MFLNCQHFSASRSYEISSCLKKECSRNCSVATKSTKNPRVIGLEILNSLKSCVIYLARITKYHNGLRFLYIVLRIVFLMLFKVSVSRNTGQ